MKEPCGTSNSNTSKTYSEIVKRIVQIDFPEQWPDLAASIVETMKKSSNLAGIQSSLLVLSLVLEKYQAEVEEKRAPLRYLVEKVFPFLENIVTCQINWANLDSTGKVVCYLILKCFHSAVFVQFEEYFSREAFTAWMFFLKKVLDQKIEDSLLVKPSSWQQVILFDASLEWKTKRVCLQIVSKILYSLRIARKKSINQRMQEIKDDFFAKFATGFMDSCFGYLKLSLTGFVSPRTIQNCFKYIMYALQIDSVADNLRPHFDTILFDLCLPSLRANQKDEENWKGDPSAFLYSQESRLDGHNVVKWAARDLMDQILRFDDAEKISMLKKLLDFTNACLQSQKNPRTGEPITAEFKDCLLSSLNGTYKQFSRDSENILGEVEQLVEHLVVPELCSEHELIKARACHVLFTYGAAYMTDSKSIFHMCKGLEACLCSSMSVVQINAIIALNKVCSNEAVIKQFAAALPQVLEIIVKCMNAIDYKELVYAAEGIIKDFGNQTLPFAVQLLKHFHSSFYQYLQNAKSGEDDDDDENDLDDEDTEANIAYESIYAAEACLEAILSLLQLDLPATLREESHKMVLVVICDILIEENNELFIKSLGLLNYVLYKEDKLTEASRFFFPVLCYILDKKPEGQLRAEAAALPESFQKVLIEVHLQELSESVVTRSLGCILNYISKLGPELHSAVDYYGKAYIELLFDTIVRTIKDAFTGPSDINIVFMLRIVIGLLEHSKDKYPFPMRDVFLSMILNVTEWNRSEQLSMHILQTISMFVWHSPRETISKLRECNKLETFYTTLYSKLDTVHEEKGKERILYGLIALFELPPDDLKVMIVLSRP